MRILIVEDHPIVGPQVKQQLEAQRYAVDLLADGADAVQGTRTIPYDLLIADVLLPILDGITLRRPLRQAKWAAHLLLLTALSMIEQRIASLEAGAATVALQAPTEDNADVGSIR